MASLLGLDLTGGTLQSLSPNASKEEQTVVINDIINRLNDQLKQMVFSDGTSKRLILGYQKGGWGPGKDFGIKVSIPGVDVTLATDAQLLFKMDLQTWFFYDPLTAKNFMQLGILPNGKGGTHIAKPGFNVSDAFS
jgi:hypothetical protein